MSSIGIAVISFFLFLLIHIFVWRYKKIYHTGVIKLFIISSLVFISGIFSGIYKDIWSYISIYWFLISFYFFIYSGVVASVSLEVLIRLLEKKQMNIDQIIQLCLNEEFLPRIKFLTQNNYISIENDNLKITTRGKFFAKLSLLMKCLYKFQKTG